MAGVGDVFRQVTEIRRDVFASRGSGIGLAGREAPSVGQRMTAE